MNPSIRQLIRGACSRRALSKQKKRHANFYEVFPRHEGLQGRSAESLVGFALVERETQSGHPRTSSGVRTARNFSAWAASSLLRSLCDQTLESLTARFGASNIEDEASFAIDSHATLDGWAYASTLPHLNPASILVACFGDPGLIALQENCPVQVTGLAEAAFFAAAKYGSYAVVTGGERWQPMLQRLAASLNQQDHLAGIHTVVPTGGELAVDPERATALLLQAFKDAQAKYKADAVILGGAGLAGFAAKIQPPLSAPIIDSVQAGIAVSPELMDTFKA